MTNLSPQNCDNSKEDSKLHDLSETAYVEGTSQNNPQLNSEFQNQTSYLTNSIPK
jgi:hypothetical protein